MQVNKDESLNVCAGIPPFFQKSMAAWLAMAALPPLPTS